MNTNKTFKVIVVGDSGSGKSSFIKRSKTEEFDGKYYPAQDPDITTIKYNDIVFKVWDNKEYRKEYRKEFYKDADAAIFILDSSVDQPTPNFDYFKTKLKGISTVLTVYSKSDILEIIFPNYISFSSKTGKNCNLIWMKLYEMLVSNDEINYKTLTFNNIKSEFDVVLVGSQKFDKDNLFLGYKKEEYSYENSHHSLKFRFPDGEVKLNIHDRTGSPESTKLFETRIDVVIILCDLTQKTPFVDTKKYIDMFGKTKKYLVLGDGSDRINSDCFGSEKTISQRISLDYKEFYSTKSMGKIWTNLAKELSDKISKYSVYDKINDVNTNIKSLTDTENNTNKVNNNNTLEVSFIPVTTVYWIDMPDYKIKVTHEFIKK